MYDLNILFEPVGPHCRRAVITGAPENRLVDAARLMSEKGVSSLVICQDGNPVGMITDRDLRTKVVAQGLDLQHQTVASVMSRPLITIREDERLFEAMHRIFHHGIHRIVVVDANCRLAGIITDSDILKLQADTPHSLIRSIEQAQSVDDLKKLHGQMQKLVSRLAGSGLQAEELLHFSALLHDEIILRLIDLLRSGRFNDLHERFAIGLLGSAGRGEHLLVSYQHSALIFADDLTPTEFQQVVLFSDELAAALQSIGIHHSPAGATLNNPTWRLSLEGFKTLFDRWIADLSQENMQKISLLSDMRTVYGDTALTAELQLHVTQRLKENDLVLDRMLEQLLRSKTPLSRFGRLHTITSNHKKLIDVKQGGLTTITDGVHLLALFKGIQAHTTAERVKWLVEASVLTTRQGDDLRSVFHNLNLFLLRAQLHALSKKHLPTHLLELDQLNPIELGELKTTLKEVTVFRKTLQHLFRFKHLL
ncbi:putative nucleotidyltransferase substrate binding domain-containing protein [Trichlorobacter sp.]|uniref:putative nucleotidyltransferase substrate binding domain-containing protein n=1 Tax=Trichlorobacter sp. TaxID=2911007 RepID=UPI002A35B8E2|nr:putative nucleotidyltransferase substrate binding domain-containing protein [Trichlorobacter sp.]MDY0384965.1 putative nucleotidyltransferase substrate binding domain-containing protein [Trichlorobacter sp.]